MTGAQALGGVRVGAHSGRSHRTRLPKSHSRRPHYTNEPNRRRISIIVRQVEMVSNRPRPPNRPRIRNPSAKTHFEYLRPNRRTRQHLPAMQEAIASRQYRDQIQCVQAPGHERRVMFASLQQTLQRRSWMVPTSINCRNHLLLSCVILARWRPRMDPSTISMYTPQKSR